MIDPAEPPMTAERAMEMLVSVDREPVVITNRLLYESIAEGHSRHRKEQSDEQKERLGLGTDADDFIGDQELPLLEDVHELRLEFYNILKIDHLWMCTSLVTLSLSNNVIETIENLESLVNLIELNLSFNKIKAIQNLNRLEKLERLSLFENKIKKVENLEGLKNLQILSLGQNDISMAKEVLVYLRQFKKLRSLNIDGNPCIKEYQYFRAAVAVFIPQLVYINYAIVRTGDKELGRKNYGKFVKKLEREEKTAKRDEEEGHVRNRRLKFLKRAYIDGFEGADFYKNLMENDAEGNALMTVNDRVKEVFFKFKEALIAASKRLYQAGEKHHIRRMKELKKFGSFLENSRDSSLKATKVIMRDFVNEKSKYFNMIADIYNHSEGPEEHLREGMKNIVLVDKDFSFLRRKTWWLLMENEMKRFERNEESLAKFELVMTDIVTKFTDVVQEEFTRMRDSETEYCDGLSDQINRFVAEFQMKGDSPGSIPFELRKILLNKETLNNYIATSHDNHLVIIDGKEEYILGSVKTWLKHLLTDINEYEINKNRFAVLEIESIINNQVEKWEAQTDGYLKDAVTYMTKVEPKWTNDIMRLKMNKKERQLDDQIQMLLNQRNEFDRKERIRRDKRRKANAEAEAEDQDIQVDSVQVETELPQFTPDERADRLDIFKKLHRELDNIVDIFLNNSSERISLSNDDVLRKRWREDLDEFEGLIQKPLYKEPSGTDIQEQFDLNVRIPKAIKTSVTKKT